MIKLLHFSWFDADFYFSFDESQQREVKLEKIKEFSFSSEVRQFDSISYKFENNQEMKFYASLKIGISSILIQKTYFNNNLFVFNNRLGINKNFSFLIKF